MIFRCLYGQNLAVLCRVCMVWRNVLVVDDAIWRYYWDKNLFGGYFLSIPIYGQQTKLVKAVSLPGKRLMKECATKLEWNARGRLSIIHRGHIPGGEQRSFQIAWCGSGAVGKSAACIQWVVGSFLDDYDPSIDDSYIKMLPFPGQESRVGRTITNPPHGYDGNGHRLMVAITPCDTHFAFCHI
jgi:hypothetical protein